MERCLKGVIFLGCFIYIWQGIQPQLLYYGFGVFTAFPLFSWDPSFVRAAFGTPGGVLNALGALLAQSYGSAWLGALVIVAVLGVLFLGLQRLLVCLRAERFRDLAWMPVIIGLTVYNYYDNPLSVLLALGFAVWLAVLYSSLAGAGFLRRCGTFLICFGMTYHLAGASALVLAGMVCLYEVLVQRAIRVGLLQAVLTLGWACAWGILLCGLEPRVVYLAGTPWDPGNGQSLGTVSHWLVLALYVLAPGLVLASGLCNSLMRRFSRRPSRTKHRVGNQKRINSGRELDARVGVGLRMLLISVTATGCLMLTRNHIRYERSLHYHACHRDWDQVISLARRMRENHAFTRSSLFDINSALAHQGQLANELCAYPQDGTMALFMTFPDMIGSLQYAKSIELYLDLGYLNAAEKTAYELLENKGPDPHVLEALVRIHLAKGELQTAKILFAALRTYVGAGPYTRPWQGVMKDPERVQQHALVQAWRKAAYARDDAVLGISFEPVLKKLLLEHPEHRLAFEYLMGYYLLKHQRAQLVRYLPMLKYLNYPQLPRHFAEALLVHAMETRTSADAQGWTIEPALRRQYQEAIGIVSKAKGNHQAAFDQLAPKYGDTYMFYSLFNVCGYK